jgi:hypothetical protein
MFMTASLRPDAGFSVRIAAPRISNGIWAGNRLLSSRRSVVVPECERDPYAIRCGLVDCVLKFVLGASSHDKQVTVGEAQAGDGGPAAGWA